jgi:NADPH2:quinone reductase
MPETQLQLRSNVTKDGQMTLSLDRVPIDEPKDNEVLIRIGGAPINPSDLGLLVGAADLSQGKSTGSGEARVLSAPIPQAFMRMMGPRIDQPMPAGNEGAGEVVRAGKGAEHLVGKTVASFGGAMYAQYRTVRAQDVLVLPEGTSARDGASCFVNPLTALAMVEAMRMEGHTALAHTAAASNLGQMLQKICTADGVQLVNIVRSDAQAKLLRDIGAKHVCDSSKPDFMEKLIAAFAETGATIAFDAIGGGKIAGQILTAMEAAAGIRGGPGGFNRYGSNTHKQVYIYGGLDPSPTELTRGFGFAFSLSGFLLMPFLQKAGPAVAEAMRQRVAREIKTTFASHYSHEISLADALTLENALGYNKKATGEKYLVNPTL